jgi:hypothetical protein
MQNLLVLTVLKEEKQGCAFLGQITISGLCKFVDFSNVEA